MAVLSCAALAVTAIGCENYDCRTRAEFHCGVTYSGFPQETKKDCLSEEDTRCDCRREARAECDGDERCLEAKYAACD